MWFKSLKKRDLCEMMKFNVISIYYSMSRGPSKDTIFEAMLIWTAQDCVEAQFKFELARMIQVRPDAVETMTIHEMDAMYRNMLHMEEHRLERMYPGCFEIVRKWSGRDVHFFHLRRDK